MEGRPAPQPVPLSPSEGQIDADLANPERPPTSDHGELNRTIEKLNDTVQSLHGEVERL